ncbi:hypothetical protein IV203_030329 [Nitzschia inconspicua]|uniref:Uncharacterized protein n=1 Tax=Nitzschia inconspicua TaxID=303405 RepID=A0A9K3LSB5_9STRA|nr:hypothetical protein IV203_030329 [Nitzschia inconspicua]
MDSSPNESPTPSGAPSVRKDYPDNSSMQQLELAMKAADDIRRSLQQNEDPLEQSLWVPPGTLYGVAAFCVTGLLLSPLRSAILSRAGRGGATASRSTETSGIIKSNNNNNNNLASSSSPSPHPSSSFQNLVDLIVTPAMAVIAAQVGLVVGTLYGSSYYLQRVVTNQSNGNVIHGSCSVTSTNDNIDTDKAAATSQQDSSTNLCQSLFEARNSFTTSQSGSADDDNILLSQDDTITIGSTFATESSTVVSPPQLYPSWDPRQTTIDSLYKAIQHCHKQQQ